MTYTWGLAWMTSTYASRATPLGVLVSQGQATASYDPARLLAFGQTYYWRVDEVGRRQVLPLYKGTTGASQ